MGYFAGSAGTADTKPAEDFSLPPAPGTATATLSGTVIDSLSGAPLPGVTVAIAGLNSGFIPDHAAVTDAAGHYDIPEVFVGTYPKVTATLAGWEPGQVELTVSAPATTQNFAIRRDWMATAGGAVVTETNGDEFADLGCGTLAAIDQSQGTAWSPGVELDAGGTVTPKVMVVALPAAIDMTSLEIDPTANCFDDPTSSVGPYRIETSVDGSTWVLAASGTFGPADLDRFNVVAVNPDAVSGIRYVRVTLLGPQIDLATQCAPVQGTGCLFMDMTEVAVYGTP
jgi:extracellular elastinolytic metalloproteinase